MFPLIPALGGIVKGAGKLIKGIGAKAKAKAETIKTAVAQGQTPATSKGFLGMFTGKKKIQKQQASAFAQGLKEQASSVDDQMGAIMPPWLMYGGIAGVVLFVLFLIFRKKK